MDSAGDYFRSTESAVKHLFAAVDSYTSILPEAVGPMFVTSTPHGLAQDIEFGAWAEEHATALENARLAQRLFISEAFALDTIAGAIVTVAAKGLEIFGKNVDLPEGLPPAVRPHLAQYCVGRLVRTLPLGLIIYAARNQHAHFNEGALREPSHAILQVLATSHGYPGAENVKDPGLDDQNPRLFSLATNITHLIGWRSFERYSRDMHQMLDVALVGE